MIQFLCTTGGWVISMESESYRSHAIKENKLETDEDKMIYKLILHRDLVGFIIKILEEKNVSCQRTVRNDQNGDILFFNKEDEAIVKETIKNLNKQFNL